MKVLFSLNPTQTSTATECLRFFENELLRKRKNNYYGEELCLILFFFIKNLQHEQKYEALSILEKDLRVNTLKDLLFSKIVELDFEYIITTIWSLGILVSGYGQTIEAEQKFKILQIMKQREIPSTHYSSLPSLAFSITCFFNEDVNELVTMTVEKLSQLYCN